MLLAARPTLLVAVAVAVAVVVVAGCSGRSQESASGASAATPPPAAPAPPVTLPPVAATELRAPEVFAAYTDKAARSRALFLEAARVLVHPRCINCHPDGDAPTQGTLSNPHDPPVTRGPSGRGVAPEDCASCHLDKNAEVARVPGAPGWHLSPRVTGWIGKSARAICEQLRAPAAEGHLALPAIVDYAASSPLVAWGFAPGADRAPAPGSQAAFASLVKAWVDTGAECPPEDAVLEGTSR